jgi:cyclohexanecarboxylate-CoA ligase
VLTATRPHAVEYDLPRTTFGECLRRACREHRDDLAVVEGTSRLTFGDLTMAAERVAAGLRDRGVGVGDTVVTQLPNWWEAVVVSWGVFLAGAVLVPVVPIYRARELGFIIRQVRPKAVFAPQEYRSYRHAGQLRELLTAEAAGTVVIGVRDDGSTPGVERFDALVSRPGPPPAEALDAQVTSQDIAVVLYTSGTTSSPKGALHSHQTLLAESRGVAALCRLDAGDRVFMASPLSHITGLSYGILLPVDLGCAVVLQSRWEAAAAVEVIERNGCTFTVSATPFLRGLAEAYAPRGQSSLRIFVCGGADIPSALVRRAHEVMGTRVVRTYGSTELPTSSMADPFGDLYAAAAGDGAAMGQNEMRLHADPAGGSELLVSGPELFLGYLDPALNRDAFTEDGFFRTGDQARIAADGTLHISGRIKDIINRGGEKFSAAEVEALLLGHPAVRDVAVVSYPDPVLVERACAYVVPADGRAPTLAELREHVVASGLAVQKAPERLVIVPSLPRTASGKVQKFVLRDRLRGEGAAAGAAPGRKGD